MIKSYIVILSFVLILVSFLDLGNYLQVATGGILLPKYVYLILVVFSIPLMVINSSDLDDFIHSRLFRWILIMITLNFFHLLFAFAVNGAVTVDIIFMRIQFLVLAAILGFVLIQCEPTVLAKSFVVVAVILSALQVFDFLNPGVLADSGTDGITVGRAGSTLVNSNKAAESLVLATIFALATLRKNLRLLLLILVFPGVAVSFSRAGTLAWGIVVLLSFVLKLIPRKATILVFISVALSSLSIGYLIFAGVSDFVDASAINNVTDRISFFSSLDVGDDSAQSRTAVALQALSDFFNNPIFGNGAGYTSVWSSFDISTHNQHLLLLAEYGLLGQFLFLWLFYIGYRGSHFNQKGNFGLKFISLVVVMFLSLFTHNMFDNLYWLVTISLLCIDETKGRKSRHFRENYV